MRSILAARQAQEKAALRERHKRLRQQLRQLGQRWPSFEEWLRSRDSGLADRWRFRERMPAVITGETDHLARPRDIRDFQAEVRTWGVLYRRLGQPSASPAFTDKGKRIVIHTVDRDSVLAALQLASQKWRTLRVSGPENYRRMCVELAAAHCFELANPELQRAVASARTARGQTHPSQQNTPAPFSVPSVARSTSSRFDASRSQHGRDSGAVAPAGQRRLDHLPEV
jgi:hypothetical protein